MFSEIQFPECPSFGFQAQPVYNVTVIRSTFGRERRNRNQRRARIQFDCTVGPRDEDAVQDVQAFFHAVNGQLIGFRFKDWTDYFAGDQPLVDNIFGGDGFQLVKEYTVGSRTLVRYIQKPVPGTIIIRSSGVQLGEGPDYTIDYTTGIVTTGHDLSTLRWDGEFDVPVRFLSELPVTLVDQNVQSVQFQLIEISDGVEAPVGSPGGGGVSEATINVTSGNAASVIGGSFETFGVGYVAPSGPVWGGLAPGDEAGSVDTDDMGNGGTLVLAARLPGGTAGHFTDGAIILIQSGGLVPTSIDFTLTGGGTVTFEPADSFTGAVGGVTFNGTGNYLFHEASADFVNGEITQIVFHY